MFVAPLGTRKILFHEIFSAEDVVFAAPLGTLKTLFYHVARDVDVLFATPLSVKIIRK